MARDLLLWDVFFVDWFVNELEYLLDWIVKFLDLVVFDEVNVYFVNGDIIYLSFIGLFLDFCFIELAYCIWDYEWIVDKIRYVVSLVEVVGCQVLGLGGYIFILIKNGKWLECLGLMVIIGNLLIVGFGWEVIVWVVWIQEV